MFPSYKVILIQFGASKHQKNYILFIHIFPTDCFLPISYLTIKVVYIYIRQQTNIILILTGVTQAKLWLPQIHLLTEDTTDL